MLISLVDVIEMPLDKLSGLVRERPYTFIKLGCDQDTFLEAVRSNHIHLAYGDWRKELEEICQILGIKPSVLK